MRRLLRSSPRRSSPWPQVPPPPRRPTACRSTTASSSCPAPRSAASTLTTAPARPATREPPGAARGLRRDDGLPLPIHHGTSRRGRVPGLSAVRRALLGPPAFAARVPSQSRSLTAHGEPLRGRARTHHLL